jgi:hypothetical protein
MPSQIEMFEIVSEIVDRAEVKPTQKFITRPEGPAGTIHSGWLIILRYWAEVPATYDWVPLAEELYNAVVAADRAGGGVEVWTQFLHPGDGQDCIYPAGSGREAEDWMWRKEALKRHTNA